MSIGLIAISTLLSRSICLIIRLLKPILLVVWDADTGRLLTVSPFDYELASGYHIVDDIGMKPLLFIGPTEEDSSVFVGIIVCPCLIVHNIIDGLANALVKREKIFL